MTHTRWWRRFPARPVWLLVLTMGLATAVAFAGDTSHPNPDGFPFAGGGTITLVSTGASGGGGPKVFVLDDALFGYRWGEHVGWISVSCVDTGKCATMGYGVLNDGAGNLAGFGRRILCGRL